MLNATPLIDWCRSQPVTRKFPRAVSLTKGRQKRRQAASLSHNCTWRPTTQHITKWSRISGLRIVSNEFANGFGRGQIYRGNGGNASRKDGLAHGTRILIVSRLDGAGTSWLIVNRLGGCRAVIAAMGRPAPSPHAFDRVEDTDRVGQPVAVRVLTPEVQHMRRWQQNKLQQHNEADEGRSKLIKRFGHQSKSGKNSESDQ